MNQDELYMRRCIQLAKNGMQNAQPNPMVGAVIVWQDRILGEGYHVRCGEAHAEVNACAAVRPEDEHLLKESTIYVSLEPCSHWGKTPPCAELLIRKGFKRCVVGCIDPFAEVQGRGVQRLREAGMEVTVGVLEAECKALNRRFMTFHGKHRPFVTLKWAQSADGFIDGHISTPYTQMLCHKRRAEHQAIMVGRRTWELDRPSLNVRQWYGKDPKIYVATRQENYDTGHPRANVCPLPLEKGMEKLYADGIQSLLVEGGTQLHQAFIDAGLWDECFVEIGPEPIHGSVAAPVIHGETQVEEQKFFGSTIVHYTRIA
ncbi:MAG: bifunctional diaminohydroxyphosphoribosylaminopyrimidine deaminase/5-amino-6-(5-phosphoribosylamino)uracil reductase RibD [Bacteroidaceae bacterium]|nr:bifunctional diaminohydroxyphosphoribosylaminopyrimidine deaminase/5-amino-6-(5-phosphoribosylamino)uracil reductase RibD [Bacteroidaceae bacterium]